MTKEVEWKVDENGCHICISHKLDRQGYPTVKRNKERMHASRYVYEKIHGELPRTVFVRHKCDNPSCVNLDHLETGTVRQNVQDRRRSGTYQMGERCPNVKLKIEDVLRIRQIYKTGDGPSLARQYGVSASAINRIVLGKSWGDALAAAREFTEEK